MTEPKDGEAPARPRIIIELGGLTDADCAIRAEGKVSTGQLYAAAWTLDAYAREIRAVEVAQAAAGLVTAPEDALALLDRMGIKIPGLGPHKAHG